MLRLKNGLLLCSIIGILFFCKSKSDAQEETGIIASGAQVILAAGDFSFTEGPASDAEGNVYFTDQPNDRIMKWSIDGALTTFMQPSGRSNGLMVDAQGLLWACADEHNQLWCITAQKETAVVLDNFEGKLLNGPNDLWIRSDGGLYFSDPYYQRDYWQRGPMEQPGQCVYYLSPDRQAVKRVVADLLQPNGIIGTPDGKMLYVTDIQGRKTYSYAIQANGDLADKKLFCEMGSDGMTIDNQGNVYLTGRGVTVFDKNGKQIAQIAVPESWTANVCFGGSDMQTLFITASKGLYTLHMNVKGVGSQ
jgi:gluconolactonase